METTITILSINQEVHRGRYQDRYELPIICRTIDPLSKP